MAAPLAINARAEVEVHELAEGCRVAIVDDFLADPEYVRTFAKQQHEAFVMPQRAYPGLTLDVSSNSMTDIYRFLRSRMSREFGFLRGDVEFSTMLSVTSLAPEELSNLQRICHVDPRRRPDRANFASVLYLFENEKLGGTSFYRWRDRSLIEEATALDLQDQDKARLYLQEQFEYFRSSPCYMTTSNDVAELLAMVPARFNRLIFYSGDIPHSAYVENSDLLTDDPSAGRLTLNTFASVHPIAGST
jgi:hypothetical protein